MKKNSTNNKKYLFVSLVLTLAVVLTRSIGTPQLAKADITFTINPGASVSSVANNLKEQKVITSERNLINEVEITNKPIQAGTFVIPANSTVADIATIITSAPESVRFTIQEGLTIKQIDARLAERGLITPSQFITCTQTCPLPENFPFSDYLNQTPRNLEGFLFPNTYFLDAGGFNTQTFLHQLLNEFNKQYASIADKNQTKYNPYQIVTMASILQKEVRTPQDFRIVSGIFWKRLENDWTLGADATLLYEKDNREITVTDLADDNPYNTRLNLGLPPTPINNPGLDMLQAAMQPEESPYWFYITTLDTGEVIYARTNEEHNANRFKYLP